MQDRPTAPELLDALAELLFADVREWVPRERRFQVLVAANVCAVLARELRAGREPTEADIELFARLAAEYEAPGAESTDDELLLEARAGAAELAAGDPGRGPRRRAAGGHGTPPRARSAQARRRPARLRGLGEHPDAIEPTGTRDRRRA